MLKTMKPENRLRARADFDRTSKGKRIVRPELVLYHTRGAGKAPRVGLAVGRRLGGAVVRNRIRRRLREAVRPILDDLDACDLVIVAREAARSAGVIDLRSALRDAVQEAGLLKTPTSLHNGEHRPRH